jgi:hypothetical protein
VLVRAVRESAARIRPGAPSPLFDQTPTEDGVKKSAG